MTTCLWSKRAHTNTDTNKTRDDTLLDHSQSLSQSSRFLCKFQRRKNTFCRLIHGFRWFIISSSRSLRAPINSRVVTSQTPHCWFYAHIAHQYYEHFIHRWRKKSQPKISMSRAVLSHACHGLALANNCPTERYLVTSMLMPSEKSLDDIRPNLKHHLIFDWILIAQKYHIILNMMAERWWRNRSFFFYCSIIIIKCQT